ncbi:hypothetical protein Vretimale_10020 [Volvox reticuliferus]|uniref:Post-GPI attachment to proteins factor 3 n=1 Tax=Volvox reticuliferus TaxID=1737510 RepID=A0A8J4BUS4_9CHLO|nr:hypothetical protein Vretifemale_772 [Volvox reticuliferus]GIM05591.1 hypothetical protein Vretimale_10020 [Volvox reticuliferus]
MSLPHASLRLGIFQKGWGYVATLLLAVVFPRCLLASSGDRAWGFQACLQHCRTTGCTFLVYSSSSQQPSLTCPDACSRMVQRLADHIPRNVREGSISEGVDGVSRSTGAQGAASQPVPLPLRIFRWSCEDDCKYHCMWAVEAWKSSAKTNGGRSLIEKYYGKWPFVRVLGMQELASVLASLANLVAHALCLHRLRAEVHVSLQLGSHPGGSGSCDRKPSAPIIPTNSSYGRSSYPFLWLWTTYGILHMNAWFWSAVFHSRDTPWTERLDYISAISLIAFGLFAAVVRIVWGPGHRRRLLAAATAVAIAAGLAAHLYYMLNIKFDYGWNMRVCVAVGVSTAGLWLSWCAWTRHPARWRMYAFLLLVHLSMQLEVLDFPPLGGLLDAHAAWHVATVALTPLFYSWLHADVLVAAAPTDPKRKDT